MNRSDIFQILKKTLKARGVTYAHLAKHLKMSESGVKKIFLAKDLPLGRLLEISAWLGVSASDLVRMMENQEIEEVDLTPMQQDAFLKDPLLFRIYWRLSVENETPERIRIGEKLSPTDLQKKFLRLERLELARIDADGRVKARHQGLFRWATGNALVDQLNHDWSKKTLDAALSETPQTFQRLSALHLTPETLAELLRRLKETVDEFARKAKQEKLIKKEKQLIPYRLLVAGAPGGFIDDV